jgi:hypothetical protein
MDRVREFQRQQEWDALVGLDQGDRIDSGATVIQYDVRRFPTAIVIGRDGRVVYNTGAIDPLTEEQSVERVARVLSIPWPQNKATPAEKPAEQVSRIRQVILSEMIEEALAKR